MLCFVMFFGFFLNNKLNDRQEVDADAVKGDNGFTCLAKMAMATNVVIMLLGACIVGGALWVGNETEFNSWAVKCSLALGVFVMGVALLAILLLCCGLTFCGCNSLHQLLSYFMTVLGFLCLCVAIFMVATSSVIDEVNKHVDQNWVKVHNTFKTDNPEVRARCSYSSAGTFARYSHAARPPPPVWRPPRRAPPPQHTHSSAAPCSFMPGSSPAPTTPRWARYSPRSARPRGGSRGAVARRAVATAR